MKKDNSTLDLKVSLRRNLLKEIANPVVMETHGGMGVIGAQVYFGISNGVVFEKDATKADALAMQRPTWAVYECDCVMALRSNVGAHLPVNFLDCDPYGDPWSVIDAFFESNREFPSVLGVAVNDGLRQKMQISGGWDVRSMASVVERHGNRYMYHNYLSVCKELLQEKAGQRGYSLTRWAGYYCGHLGQMTHYAAKLNR